MDKKFTYSLVGLQRVQNYQLDQLTSRLAVLKEELRRNQELIESLETQIKGFELELVRLFCEQPTFWLESRGAITHYLADCRSERQLAVEAHEKLMEQILRLISEIVESQKSKKLLERHKNIMHDRHRRSESNKHSMFLDEHVLRKSMLNQHQKRGVV